MNAKPMPGRLLAHATLAVLAHSAAWAACPGPCNCSNPDPSEPVYGAEEHDPVIPRTGLYVSPRHFSGANAITVLRREVAFLDTPRAQSCPGVGSRPSMSGSVKAAYCAYTDGRTRTQEERPDAMPNPKLDIYHSTAPAWTALRKPAVVLLHGGNFRTNGKRNAGPDNWRAQGESCDTLPAALAQGDPNNWSLLARSYVCAGYVAVSVSYRMRDLADPPYVAAEELADRKLKYTGARGQRYDDTEWEAVRNGTIRDALDDIDDAIRYLKREADALGIDPTRIVTLGASAGGTLSLLNALRANERAPNAWGHTAQVRAALSTGATLTDNTNRILNPEWQINPDAGDAPILLYHARPCDCGTGLSWAQHVLPTQNDVRNLVDGVNRGTNCNVLAHNLTDAQGQQVYVHMMPLSLYDDEPGPPPSMYALHAPTVRQFLYRELALCELRGEPC